MFIRKSYLWENSVDLFDWNPCSLPQSFFNFDNLTMPPFGDADVSAADAFMIGFARDKAERFDSYFSHTVREELFSGGMGEAGLDLVALNIQRAREHGLPGKRARINGLTGKRAKEHGLPGKRAREHGLPGKRA